MIPKPPTPRYPREALIWMGGLAVLAVLGWLPMEVLDGATFCIP